MAATRTREPADVKQTAAANDNAAATRTTPGAPSVFSRGISARQPAAAPIRSAA